LQRLRFRALCDHELCSKRSGAGIRRRQHHTNSDHTREGVGVPSHGRDYRSARIRTQSATGQTRPDVVADLQQSIERTRLAERLPRDQRRRHRHDDQQRD
jgi:hypothetical protein